jgi:RNA polymerase sigma factor (sigma-70 family)
MKTVSLFILISALWFSAVQAACFGDAVEVRIVADDGRTLPIYPVTTSAKIRKVYAEAVKGDHYRIDVRNLMNRRIGLVMAVDGRNIISGTKSWLKNSERMYILEPYGSGSFAGWRTAQDRINRFYFTDVPDSYAAAFGDESAMGVIALAVYPEVTRLNALAQTSRISPSPLTDQETKGRAKADKPPVLPSAPGESKDVKENKAARSEGKLESAGTGYGRDEYSYARIVAFDPEKIPIESQYIKYEWRSTLCQLGVISCAQPFCRRPNRLWDHEGVRPSTSGKCWKVRGKQASMGVCPRTTGKVTNINYGSPKAILRENVFPEKINPVDAHRIIEEDDESYVLRCQQGETEAFARLVRRHQKKMLNLAYRMIGDYQEACDVVQEAFLSAFRSIGKFRGEARFSTWLGSIVLNQARGHLKQRSVRLGREEMSLDDPDIEGKRKFPIAHLSVKESVVEGLERRELEGKIQKCLDALEVDHREVLVLRDIQGCSYEAIGQTLKLPPGTVRSRLFRARNALKDSLLKVIGALQ